MLAGLAWCYLRWHDPGWGFLSGRSLRAVL